MELKQEQEFILAYQNGTVSKDELLLQYRKLIYFFIAKKRVQLESVEDCFQDCVIRLFECAMKYDFRESKFTSYLLSDLRRITTEYQRDTFYWNRYFKSISEISHSINEKTINRNGFEAGSGMDVYDLFPAPAEAEVHEFRDKLQTAISSLTKDEKKIIYLHFFQELPLSEIGRILNLRKSRVQYCETLALRKMRNAIEIEVSFGKVAV